MKIAVVILNWNGKQLLEQFLPSIIAHSQGLAGVYVADNNSSDDSVAFVKANYPQVTLVRNAENGGYAKGYNDALKNIEADIYCLINSDVEVTKNWLVPVVEAFQNAPELAVIQPKILDYNSKNTFEYAGAGGGFTDSLGYLYCRGRVFSTLENDSGQYDTALDIHWASGACFFVRSSVFHELNGFDEGFFAHQEEVDLCWRIRNAGHRIAVAPKAIIYHVGGATLSVLNPQKTYLNFRNSLFTLTKNLPSNRLFLVLFIRLCLDGLAVVKYLFELKPRHGWAILKAHLHFYRKWAHYRAKRKEQDQKQRRYYQIRSIVWKYFILGKKKYSQIDS